MSIESDLYLFRPASKRSILRSLPFYWRVFWILAHLWTFLVALLSFGYLDTNAILFTALRGSMEVWRRGGEE